MNFIFKYKWYLLGAVAIYWYMNRTPANTTIIPTISGTIPSNGFGGSYPINASGLPTVSGLTPRVAAVNMSVHKRLRRVR